MMARFGGILSKVAPGLYCFETPSRSVREHLVCQVVERLVPETQKHDIEGW